MLDIDEVKKILGEALWMAYCSGRAGIKYMPEEVLPDLLKRCQLQLLPGERLAIITKPKKRPGLTLTEEDDNEH